jgi:hypothetical protein
MSKEMKMAKLFLDVIKKEKADGSYRRGTTEQLNSRRTNIE